MHSRLKKWPIVLHLLFSSFIYHILSFILQYKKKKKKEREKWEKKILSKWTKEYYFENSNMKYIIHLKHEDYFYIVALKWNISISNTWISKSMVVKYISIFSRYCGCRHVARLYFFLRRAINPLRSIIKI